MPATRPGEVVALIEHDRQPVARRPPFVDAIDDLLDLVGVREVLGERLTRRVHHRRRTRRARACPVGLRAAGRRPGSRARCSSTARRDRCAGSRGGPRRRRRTRRPPRACRGLGRDLARARRCRGRGSRRTAASARRRRRAPRARDATYERGPAGRVEPGGAARERRAQLLGDVGRQQPDAVGSAERRVREVDDAQVRTQRAQLRGDERELVVLHEHDRRLRARRRPRPSRTPRSPRRTRPTLRGSGRSNRGRRTVSNRSWKQEPQHAVRNDVVVQLVLVRVEVEQVQVDAEVVGLARFASRRRRRRSSPPRSTCAPPASRAATARARSTTPPAPRRAENVPSSLRKNRYGPRCETTITCVATLRSANSRSQSSSSRVEQEVAAHGLPTRLRPSRRPVPGSREQLGAARRRLLDVVDEVAVHAVLDLQRDAAAPAADDRAGPSTVPRLTVRPNPSRNDFWMTTSAARWNALICTEPTCWMFDSRWMFGSPARASFGELPVVEPLGVVGGHRTREHELGVGHVLAHQAERLDHADRVLPRVEAAHLHEQRIVGAHAVALAELLDERIGEVEVLHRERVDARRRVHDAVHRERRGHELRHRPHRRVVLLDVRAVEVPHRRVRVGEVDVAAPDPLRARAGRRRDRGRTRASRPAAGRGSR